MGAGVPEPVFGRVDPNPLKAGPALEGLAVRVRLAMVVDRAKLSSSGALAGPPATVAHGASPLGVSVVLLGTNEDTKLLLKGLLRLRRYAVGQEARSAEELEAGPSGEDPRVLLLDAEAVTGGWEAALREAHQRQPGLRIVLLTFDRSPELSSRALASGARVVLGRPFSMAEFWRAVESASQGG
jgi:CheY-like chemotaxis protein